MGQKVMIKVTSGGGNAHYLHIKAAVIHHAPLCAVFHHGDRQHSGKMVSIVIIGSTGRIVFYDQDCLCSPRIIILSSLRLLLP